ncbi:MAG: DHH family phosphoesterase [Candidatus Omnitrophica bacterium]|nr:DHH family phosphoesterase [Candidatus Omnitrophota bacterium]
MNYKEMQSVIDAIKERDNFILSSHIKPEGDSIGSQLAMKSLLLAIGKKAAIINQDPVPDNMKFLRGAESISDFIPSGFIPQTIIYLDSPLSDRVGSVGDLFDDGLFSINIDHHVSNEYFADVNWVEKDMSSAGEMVHLLYSAFGLKHDMNTAEIVYAAIVTDTGMFNYDNTSPDTHRIAADLITSGVLPNKMFRNIYEGKEWFQVKILGKVLSSLVIEEGGRVAHISLTKEMVHDEGLKYVSTEEFINYPRAIKGVSVAVFFNENAKVNDSISIGFRSNSEIIDVNEIASKFGGGGHKKAAGCYYSGTLDEARKAVLSEIKRVL